MTSPEPSDQSLRERVRMGDREAFERLFRRYYPELLRFARGQVREETEADDVVHDVLLRVWRERATMGGERSLRAYLLAAVRNRVIDIARRRKAEQRWVVASTDDKDHSRMVEAISLPSAESDAAALAELDDAIRRGVAALPERCRAAFLLCRGEGLSYAEAAEVMGVAPATVKTQMARALASLRSALEPYLAVLLTIPSLFR